MSRYGTVRLSPETRDELKAFAESEGFTVDRAVREAIHAYRWEQDRRQAEREMRDLANDPVDRAEVRAALRDMGADI